MNKLMIYPRVKYIEEVDMEIDTQVVCDLPVKDCIDVRCATNHTLANMTPCIQTGVIGRDINEIGDS